MFTDDVSLILTVIHVSCERRQEEHLTKIASVPCSRKSRITCGYM